MFCNRKLLTQIKNYTTGCIHYIEGGYSIHFTINVHTYMNYNAFYFRCDIYNHLHWSYI